MKKTKKPITVKEHRREKPSFDVWMLCPQRETEKSLNFDKLNEELL